MTLPISVHVVLAVIVAWEIDANPFAVAGHALKALSQNGKAIVADEGLGRWRIARLVAEIAVIRHRTPPSIASLQS